MHMRITGTWGGAPVGVDHADGCMNVSMRVCVWRADRCMKVRVDKHRRALGAARLYASRLTYRSRLMYARACGEFYPLVLGAARLYMCAFRRAHVRMGLYPSIFLAVHLLNGCMHARTRIHIER